MSAQAHIAFETTRPVTGDAFFGRARELHICEQRVRHKQSILITGESRIGKTSLLRELESRAREVNSATRVISADCYNYGYYPKGVRGLASALLRQLGSELGEAPGQGGPQQLVRWASRSEIPIVAFLNDFDAMLRLSPDSEEDGYFLKALVDAGHTAVCGVAQRSGFFDNAGRLIPFPVVSFFDEVPLSGLTKEEAFDLLSNCSLRSGDRFTKQECEHIVALIGTIPNRLQHFGFDLFSNQEFMGSTGGQRLDLLTEAFERSVSRFRNEFLHRIADEQLGSDAYWTRLVDIAHGDAPGDDPEADYLRKRGFISKGHVPFLLQGALYREFLRSIPRSDSKGTPIRQRLARAGGVAVEAAIKTVVSGALS